MFSLFHSCMCGKCKCTTDSIFATAKENGRKLTIKNNDNSHICIIKLDGCVFPKGNTTSKCDYLFTFESSNRTKRKLLFVELKGGNVDDAYIQLESSINFYNSICNDHIKEAIIIAKKCPKADDSKAKKKKAYFAEKLRTKLFMKTDECVINHSFFQ